MRVIETETEYFHLLLTFVCVSIVVLFTIFYWTKMRVKVIWQETRHLADVTCYCEGHFRSQFLLKFRKPFLDPEI